MPAFKRIVNARQGNEAKKRSDLLRVIQEIGVRVEKKNPKLLTDSIAVDLVPALCLLLFQAPERDACNPSWIVHSFPHMGLLPA